MIKVPSDFVADLPRNPDFGGMAPVSKSRRDGRFGKVAGGYPAGEHHCRTVDRAIPSKVASPQSFSPLHPARQLYGTGSSFSHFGHGGHPSKNPTAHPAYPR